MSRGPNWIHGSFDLTLVWKGGGSITTRVLRYRGSPWDGSLDFDEPVDTFTFWNTNDLAAVHIVAVPPIVTTPKEEVAS